ncbi:MaoC family dehydratase [Micromonospora parathelypteridis]|uniref:Acyl dehydratase n=1 Tax=Micromonospora parathelypteridis TaxID=1839617 RepID=A0A840VIU1_9ACTN|nr:MaoC family dehydratase [Micromonospora parathelypteridis]MBB5475786.1 acyl dehydratase [Micromonospora parathelypteridis]GGO26588.1 MaoC family dehydratase [Micromonospora parathelypteridis]
MRVFSSFEDLTSAVGETLGPGPWQRIEQGRVDLFADATDDHQWIHLDPVRAAAGPFGGTIAHGYLTLSLLPALAGGLYRVEGVAMGVNYGLNRVRFPAPVRVGASVRATATIAEVSPVIGGVQLVATVSVESDSGGKPVCVAETVSRLYGAEGR